MLYVRHLAMRCLLAGALLGSFSGAATSQTSTQAAYLSPDAIARTLETYYRGTSPETIHEVIQAALIQGHAEQRPKRLKLIAFMAGLIATDPKHLDRLAPMFARFPAPTSEAIVRAVLYSGRTDWQHQIARLKTLWPGQTDMIDRIAARGMRPVYALKRDGQPEVIDMNWAFFSATGRREPVMAIIETLADLDAKDPAKVALAHAARLSLAKQSMKHQAVYNICLRAQMGSFGDQMRLIVVAANNRDLSTFKADADAAIKAATEGKPVPIPQAVIMTTRTGR